MSSIKIIFSYLMGFLSACKDNSLTSIIPFIKLNFFSNHIRRFGFNAYIYIHPKVFIQFSTNSIIELYGPLKLGFPELKNHSCNSSLIMEDYTRIIVKKRCKIIDGFNIKMHHGSAISIDDFCANQNLCIFCKHQIRLLGKTTVGSNVTFKDSDKFNDESGIWIAPGTTIANNSFINTSISLINESSNKNLNKKK